jgi:Flp pilus assembly protein TadD
MFPVAIKLTNSLISIDESQEKILSNIKSPNRQRVFELIFYFSPYKMFNAGKSVSYIRKGGKNLYIDEIKRAKHNYIQSAKISLRTGQLLDGIKFAIEHQTRKAQDVFIDLVEQIDEDSVFNYDLGLTYAQLGNFEYAYNNFKKSFYLDESNMLAGVFALMSAKLANISNNDLSQRVKKSISDYSENNEEAIFYDTLYGFVDNTNSARSLTYLESEKYNTTLETISALMVAILKDKKGYAKQISAKLKKKLSDDIVANVLYFHTSYSHLDTKKFAQKGASFLQEKSLRIDSLYHGPNIARKMYIELAKISGLGYTVRDILKERTITETKNTIGVLQSLALADLHLGFYEESYVIYNKLIDDLNQRDPETLFLAAIASMGSEHFANAAVLLKLVNIKSKSNYEARLGLGLLFLQNGNLKSAKTQLNMIKSNNFKSEYFDFDIDNKKPRIKNATKDSNTTK